jgi:hypothetical protein
MPTQCRPEQLVFAPVEGRSVVASFTGGAITSDAGALLLGATDRAIGLVERFTGCFQDARDPDLIEHEMATLIGQRVFGLALGYGISSTTTNSATIRSWRCSPASSRPAALIALPWPANRP